MKKLILLADVLSPTPELMINESSKYKTLLGGLFSIFTYVCIVAIGGYFSNIMFSRSDKSVTYYFSPTFNQTFDMYRPSYALMVTSRLGGPLVNTSRYFSVESTFYDFHPDGKGGIAASYRPIKNEACKLSNLSPEDQSLFKYAPFYNYHVCPAQNQSLSMKGAYSEVFGFNILIHFVIKCQNNTSLGKTDCYPKEQIDSYLEGSNLLVKFVDYTFNHSNIDSPGNKYMRSEAFNLNPQLMRKEYFDFRNVYYTSDMGLIFESYTDSLYYSVGLPRETTDLIDSFNRMAYIQFSIDSKSDFYQRTFLKAQTVIANIGGIIKALFVVSKMMTFLFTNELYYFELISSLFKLDDSKLEQKASRFSIFRQPINMQQLKDFDEASKVSNKRNADMIKNEDVEGSSSNNNDKIINSANMININKLNLERNVSMYQKKHTVKVDEEKLPEHSDIHMSFYGMLCPTYMICGEDKKTKSENYKMLKSQILKKLCIKNLVTKINEVDKLKLYSMDERQARKFNQHVNKIEVNL